ncbi:MAG TPA: hypothetical protein VEP90_03795 [Methylomirabilota bacterium]|nr:hypothetical protein [Methylomirabilota bacterium]
MSKALFRGYAAFFAILLSGMFILYDDSGVIQRQPFINHLFNGNGSTVGPSLFSYYEVVSFFFWIIIIPTSFYLLCIYSIPKSSGKGGFHR